jgi:ribosomal protein L34
MKTTVDIHNSLLEEARQQALRENTTVKALIEEGLQRIISDRTRKSGFLLRKATFKGRGLQADVRDASWEFIRNLSYKGRGT